MAVEAKKYPRQQMVDNDGNLIGGSADVPIHVSTGGVVASEVHDGRQVVATPGTAVALATSTTCKRVTVVANEDNTGIVVVGGSTVVAALATRRGVPLHPLDSHSLDADNLDEIFLDAMVAANGVTFDYTV